MANQESRTSMSATGLRVRSFSTSVTYRDASGEREEAFPVRAHDYITARRLAEEYVLKILKLQEFDLRIVGA
jgi:hypothetical protein